MCFICSRQYNSIFCRLQSRVSCLISRYSQTTNRSLHHPFILLTNSITGNEAFFNLSKKSSSKNNSEKSSASTPEPPITSTPESPTMSSLTIFDLIEPKSLPNLYGMLALALHDVGIVEVETLPSLTPTFASGDSTANNSTHDHSTNSHHGTKRQKHKPSHLSITLPCKKLPQSKDPHNVSVRRNFVFV